MMRFKGGWDQYPAKDRFRKTDNPRTMSLAASNWPTINELEEVISPMTADTVLQILRGDGIFRGYDCVDPDVYTKEQLKRYKANLEYEHQAAIDTRTREHQAISNRRRLLAKQVRKLEVLDCRLAKVAVRISKQGLRKRKARAESEWYGLDYMQKRAINRMMRVAHISRDVAIKLYTGAIK